MLFHFSAVPSVLLDSWSAVCAQASCKSILDMGGLFSEAGRSLPRFKIKEVFVVRKFSGKRMVLSLSLWSTAGLRRFPVAGLPALVAPL